MQGDFGVLKLGNNSKEVTVELRGGEGRPTLGSNDAGTVDGELIIKGSQGRTAIHCHGATGIIDCVDVLERPIPSSLAGNIAPLMNALDRVLALRAVTCQREQATVPTAAADGDAQQIGFDGQELEAVCPELVVTDA